jgi:hypothetical protein
MQSSGLALCGGGGLPTTMMHTSRVGVGQRSVARMRTYKHALRRDKRRMCVEVLLFLVL